MLNTDIMANFIGLRNVTVEYLKAWKSEICFFDSSLILEVFDKMCYNIIGSSFIFLLIICVFKI